MKKGLLVFLGLVISLLFLTTNGHAGYVITQIADNSVPYTSVPNINNNGNVVLEGFDGNDSEIYLYNGTTIIQLTDNDYDDTAPQISDNGDVVWQGFDGNDLEIFLDNGTTIIQLTDNDYDDDAFQINDNGNVVWQGFDGNDWEIFLDNGTMTLQLTDNDYDDTAPQISNNGDVIWINELYQLYFYDGAITFQLVQDNIYYLKINDNGDVVWHYSAQCDNISLYDGTATKSILYNDCGAITASQISNNGYVVWQKFDYNDWEIYLYNGTTTIQITDNDYDEENVVVNDNGYVVWERSYNWRSGNTSLMGVAVYLYDGITTQEISEPFRYYISQASPKINKYGYVVYKNAGSDNDALYLYDGATTLQLANRAWWFLISDNGDVVWENYDGLFIAKSDEDVDIDDDGIGNNFDNCPDDYNGDQADADLDLIGDVCDPFPYESDHEKAQLILDLAQALEDLAQAQTDLTQTQEDLAQAQADLAQAQTDISQCSSNYTQCSIDLSTSEANLTQCSNDLTQCNTDLSQCHDDAADGVETISELNEIMSTMYTQDEYDKAVNKAKANADFFVIPVRVPCPE